MTKTMIVLGLVAMVLVSHHGVHAQTAGNAYCAALVQKYEQYLDKDGRQGIQPQSLDARAAAERCKAGDASGVPALEKALKDAKIDLPPKT